MKPIYEGLHERLNMCSVLHADETTLQVLREPGKGAQSKSYMWLYRTGSDARSPIVLYDYQPDRRAKHPIAFLKGFEGYLHTEIVMGVPLYRQEQELMAMMGIMPWRMKSSS